MGRHSKSRSLAVWMNGELVGHWRLPAGGEQEFAYVDSWLQSPATRPLSLSLPLRPAAQPFRAEVPAFFENLLPDNAQIRSRMQRRFGTATDGAFDLLEEAGRDCVGALQLMREGEAPPPVLQITATRLTPSGVERLLTGALGTGFGQEAGDEEGFRISLAGAQEKTALLWHEGAWHRPTGATPTTHILKLPIGVSQLGLDLSTSVENEWLCAQIVRAYGIPIAPCRIIRFGQYTTLVVERFDRRLADDRRWWLRLPQEDLCQATGTPPALKYESDGGPGIGRIMELLLGSSESEADRRDFLRTQLVFWLLAAIDGHAKNFSIFHLAGGGFKLTPRYDVLSAYPVIGHGRGKLSPKKIKMAMAVEGVNRHYHWEGIRARHWRETARRFGLPDIDGLIAELVESAPAVITAVRQKLPEAFPSPIADTILNGTEEAARQLAEDMVRR